ncbi:MAG: uroporphyrinogen-III synthase [Gammaproteobacteria bacterium]
MGELEGVGIVVTRPDDAEDRLSRRLASEGARVLFFPALEIVPLDPPASDGPFDAALFTSPAAVHHGWPRLVGRFPERLLAPGSGTRAALLAAGASTVRIPARGAGMAALLQSLPADFLAGNHLLVVCGEPLNRKSLDVLAERGAEVTPWPVYARRPCENPHPLSDWIHAGEADVIMASSSAAVTALMKLPKSGVTGIGWIVSSPRVARAAAQAGAEVVATAQSAEARDLSVAAIHWWQSEGKRVRA